MRIWIAKGCAPYSLAHHSKCHHRTINAGTMQWVSTS
jgi:hypothetical protein